MRDHGSINIVIPMDVKMGTNKPEVKAKNKANDVVVAIVSIGRTWRPLRRSTAVCAVTKVSTNTPSLEQLRAYEEPIPLPKKDKVASFTLPS